MKLNNTQFIVIVLLLVVCIYMSYINLMSNKEKFEHCYKDKEKVLEEFAYGGSSGLTYATTDEKDEGLNYY